MQYRLLLILLLSTSIATAQNFSKVKPFTDYSNCSTGFINTKGDTIWPLQFEHVSQAKVYLMNAEYSYHSEMGWIVEYNGLYGAIDVFGNKLIPFEYESISLLINGKEGFFLVKKNGKYGVCDQFGKLILPTKYDYISNTGMNQYYYHEDNRFGENDKVGLFDENFNVLIPAEYDDIEYVWDEYYVQVDSTSRYFPVLYYQVSREGRVGLIDTSGRIVVPVEYEGAYPIFPQSDCAFEQTYFSTYRNDKNGIYSVTKGDILPPEYDNIDIYYNTPSCGLPYNAIAHTTTFTSNGKHSDFMAIDLVTGKRTQDYDGLSYYEGYTFFQDGKKFGIMDSALNVIVEDKPFFFYYQSPAISGHYTGVKLSDQVLFISDPKPVKRKSVNSYPSPGRESKSGLYDLKSGRSTDIIYDRIEIKRTGTEVYYWAVQYRTIGPDILTVFNRDLEVVRQIEMHRIEELFSRRYNEYILGESIHLIIDKDDKIGMLTPSGKDLIPFEYDSRRVLDSWNRDTTRLMLAKGDRRGVFDMYGKMLIPPIYDSVAHYDDGLGMGILNGKYDGYIFGEKKLEGQEKLFVSGALDFHHSIKYWNYGEHRMRFSFYLIRTDTLFIYEDDQFVKMDEKRLRFTNPLQKVHNYLINKRGRVIMGGEYTLQLMGDVALAYNMHETNLLDEEGNTLLHLDGFYYFDKFGDYYRVRYDKKFGIINSKTLKWVFEPQYEAIEFAHNGYMKGQDFFQVSESKYSWKILDQNGKQALPFTMEYPVRFHNRDITAFRSGGKLGLMNRDMEVLLEPIYVRMYYHHGIIWFMENGLWGAYKVGYPTLYPQFQNISLVLCSDKQIAFTPERKWVFISSKLEVSTPKTRNELLYHSDLYKELDMRGGVYYVKHHLKSEEGHTSYDKFVNNFNLLLIAEKNTFTQEEPFVKSEAQFRPQNSRSVYNSADDLYRINYMFLDMHNRKGRYYSYVEAKEFGMIHYSFYNDLADIRGTSTVGKVLKTIDLQDSTLSPIRLSELFKENSGYEVVLDELLKQKIIEMQLFGTVCADMNGAIAELKRNYFVGDFGIHFFRNKMQRPDVIVSYKDLREYLKYPEEFQVQN